MKAPNEIAYIAVASEDGVITSVYPTATVDIAEAKLIIHFEWNSSEDNKFNQETDDARIFDIKGNEVKSLFHLTIFDEDEKSPQD